MDVDAHVALRVHTLRTQRNFTLEVLAELSGVSRSMISLIERGQTSPTAAVLDKLAVALGVPLASLFTEEKKDANEVPMARAAQQSVWKDPESGYVRRHLSPPGFGSPIELVEVHFPPGESVAFESPTRHVVTHQQVWVIEGEMQITVGETPWRIKEGDCFAMALDQRIVFKNPARKRARYLIAVTAIPPTARRN